MRDPRLLTEKQETLLSRLIVSSAFSEEERTKYYRWLASDRATRVAASALIAKGLKRVKAKKLVPN